MKIKFKLKTLDNTSVHAIVHIIINIIVGSYKLSFHIFEFIS